MENVFLTPEVCSFDPGGGGAFHPPTTDHHATNTQHKKREFNVFYKTCSFDPADTQASKQTIYFSKTLLYEKENKGDEWIPEIQQNATVRFSTSMMIEETNDL